MLFICILLGLFLIKILLSFFKKFLGIYGDYYMMFLGLLILYIIIIYFLRFNCMCFYEINLVYYVLFLLIFINEFSLYYYFVSNYYNI